MVIFTPKCKPNEDMDRIIFWTGYVANYMPFVRCWNWRPRCFMEKWDNCPLYYCNISRFIFNFKYILYLWLFLQIATSLRPTAQIYFYCNEWRQMGLMGLVIRSIDIFLEGSLLKFLVIWHPWYVYINSCLAVVLVRLVNQMHGLKILDN